MPSFSFFYVDIQKANILKQQCPTSNRTNTHSFMLHASFPVFGALLLQHYSAAYRPGIATAAKSQVKIVLCSSLSSDHIKKKRQRLG